MYGRLAQRGTDQTSNGCSLNTGDLLASGTISGTRDDSHGCLLEITGGSHPLELPGGEQRIFLADGDEITLHGFFERSGATRLGFCTCAGIVLLARVSVTTPD